MSAQIYDLTAIRQQLQRVMRDEPLPTTEEALRNLNEALAFYRRWGKNHPNNEPPTAA